MAVPAFTADASLYRTRNRYGASASSRPAATAVRPQYDPYAACRNDCVECAISGPTSYFCNLCQTCMELANTI